MKDIYLINIKVKIKELPPENLKKDYIEDYIEIVE